MKHITKLTPEPAADSDGKPTKLIPLDSYDQPAKLLADDFEELMSFAKDNERISTGHLI